MSSLTRYIYYARSVVTLLTRFEQPGRILRIFTGQAGALPAEVRLRQEGWRFQVREAMDVWVIKETCIDGDYVRQAALQPDWQVVDIGAGLGDFSVYAAARCPDGVVHAYEPLAESFALLQHNLALNGLKNVKVFHQATGPAGHVQAAGKADQPAVSVAFEASGEEIGVASLTLSQVLDRLPESRCDFLKVDCEGCEYDLLLGCPPETLAKVQRISAETHDQGGHQPAVTGHSAAALAAFLSENGFRIIRRPNPVHSHLGFLFAERA